MTIPPLNLTGIRKEPPPTPHDSARETESARVRRIAELQKQEQDFWEQAVKEKRSRSQTI